MRCPGSIAHAFIQQTFVSTWRVRGLAPLRFTNPRAAELSVYSTIVPSEHLHNLLHWSLVAIPSHAPPTSATSSDSPELRHTMFCFLEDAYTGYHVFSTEHLTQTANSRVAATVFDASSPISIGHHHDRTLRRARNTRNKIATNDHVACRISNQISQQTLDVDFITSGSCADVREQFTNVVLDFRTIQPE